MGNTAITHLHSYLIESMKTSNSPPEWNMRAEVDCKIWIHNNKENIMGFIFISAFIYCVKQNQFYYKKRIMGNCVCCKHSWSLSRALIQSSYWFNNIDLNRESKNLLQCKNSFFLVADSNKSIIITGWRVSLLLC